MEKAKLTRLRDRALISVEGGDWRSFLQGLLTQDVETQPPGTARYACLLTPQGRLLYDLFVWAENRRAILDVAEQTRDALAARLSMYRLRAKVEITTAPGEVHALFADCGEDEGASGPGSPGEPWARDPRLEALGWRAITPVGASSDAETVDADAYDLHRLRLGVGDLALDGLADRAYALEANLDLLNAVDFKKGCFVGQETTSRMKRRGSVKTRLVPVVFDGETPARGSEVLAGDLRAGEIASGRPGLALASLRLDRAQGSNLTTEGRPLRLAPASWLRPVLAEFQPAEAG